MLIKKTRNAFKLAGTRAEVLAFARSLKPGMTIKEWLSSPDNA